MHRAKGTILNSSQLSLRPPLLAMPVGTPSGAVLHPVHGLHSQVSDSAQRRSESTALPLAPDLFSRTAVVQQPRSARLNERAGEQVSMHLAGAPDVAPRANPRDLESIASLLGEESALTAAGASYIGAQLLEQAAAAQSDDQAAAVASVCIRAIEKGASSAGSERAFKRCMQSMSDDARQPFVGKVVAALRYRVGKIATSIGTYEEPLGSSDYGNVLNLLSYATSCRRVSAQLLYDMARALTRYSPSADSGRAALMLLALGTKVPEMSSASAFELERKLTAAICYLASEPKPLDAALDYYAELMQQAHESLGDHPSLHVVSIHAAEHLVELCERGQDTAEARKKVAFVTFLLDPRGARGHQAGWLKDLSSSLLTASLARVTADLARSLDMPGYEVRPMAELADLSLPLAEYHRTSVRRAIHEWTGWPHGVCQVLVELVGQGLVLPSSFDDALAQLGRPVDPRHEPLRRGNRERRPVSGAAFDPSSDGAVQSPGKRRAA